MKPESSIFDQAPADSLGANDAAMAEAEADMAAGRVVAHDKVAEWLKTWGTAEEASAPASWLK